MQLVLKQNVSNTIVIPMCKECRHLLSSHGAVDQLVDYPLKVPVWCNSTDVGSNHDQETCHLSDHAVA